MDSLYEMSLSEIQVPNLISEPLVCALCSIARALSLSTPHRAGRTPTGHTHARELVSASCDGRERDARGSMYDDDITVSKEP